jgi:hypothetical protein
MAWAQTAWKKMAKATVAYRYLTQARSIQAMNVRRILEIECTSLQKCCKGDIKEEGDGCSGLVKNIIKGLRRLLSAGWTTCCVGQPRYHAAFMGY